MLLSQIPILPWQHCHAAVANTYPMAALARCRTLLLACWQRGVECPLCVAAEEDGLMDNNPPPRARAHT